MKKILLGLVVLCSFIQCFAQDVKIPYPVSYGPKAWIHVADTMRVRIIFQGMNDTLATQAYARGFAGGSLSAGYGIKVTGSQIAIDSFNYRKMDSLYAVNDSTLVFPLNGKLYSFKFRGAVMAWNNRIGQVMPQDNDYAAFYAKLDSTYHDPSFISALSWAKIITTPITLAGYGITNGVLNAGGVYQWQADVIANRPPNPTNGTFFFGTDDSTVFYYNGARWITVAGGGIDSLVNYSYGLLKTTAGTTINVKVDTTTLKGVFGSGSGGIFQIFTKYGLLINGTDTATVDTTIFARYADTVNGRLATRNWVLTRGFLSAETDPVATAKTTNLSGPALAGVVVSGSTSQAIGSNPTYTFKADTTVLGTLTALKDTAAILRALISSGGLTQVYTKFGLIKNGTDTLSVDSTLFLRFKDTSSTVATKNFVTTRGYVITETDPVATKDTITINPGPGVLVTGLSKQALGNTPTWTFKVDSSIVATLLALKDTAAAIRAAFPTGYLTQVYTKYGLLKTGTDTLTVDTTLFTRFKDTLGALASHTALLDTAAAIRAAAVTIQALTLGSGITGGAYNGSAAVTAKADTTLLATLLALKDTAIALRAKPDAVLTLGFGLTGGTYNGATAVTTKIDTTLVPSLLALKDTAAVLRAIIPSAYDSAHSQGGGFHTQAYYDQRYVPFSDTFYLNIVKIGQGLNLANGVNNMLVMKAVRDSGSAQLLVMSDSSAVTYVQPAPGLPLYNEKTIRLTNGHVWDGNSITVCATCPFPALQGYTVLMGDTLGLISPVNRGVSNSTIMDLQARQFINDPSSGVAWSYSIMIGENNFGEDTSTHKYMAVSEGVRAAIANHFMDTVWSVSNSYVTKTGAWSNVTAANFLSKSVNAGIGNPMKSSTLNNSISFTIYDDNVVIGTYGFKAGGYGSVSIGVDGTLKINPRTGTTVWTGADMATNFSSQINTYDPRQPIVWIITGMGIGAHTVTITLLQNTEVDFDYVGKLMPPIRAAGMMVWHVTKRQPLGYFSYGDVGGGPAGIDSINRLIDTVCNSFRLLGLPVATVHSNQYLNNNVFYMDGLHPLPAGHVLLADAGLAVINRNTGSGATTDTATIVSNGLESVYDKNLLIHPTWEKNPSGLSSAYDTTGYSNLDTAFKKADSTGWGLGKNVTQKAIAHFIDTATFNLHTGGFNDARYAPFAQPWTVSGSSLFPSNLGYNIGIGTNSPSAPLTVVGFTVFADTNLTAGAINKNGVQISLIQNARANGGTTSMTGVVAQTTVNAGDTLTNAYHLTVQGTSVSGKLINAYGVNATGGTLTNVVNWFPFSAADVTVAGQAKIYSSALTAGSGKWAGFFSGGAPLYQAGNMNIGAGDSLGHSAALLDMSSTTQGVLIPRMTTAQQNAIGSAVAGLLIFNSDSVAFMFYNGSSWTKLGSGSGGAGGTYVTNIIYPDSLHEVFVFNTGRTDTIAYNTFTGGGLADPGGNGIVYRSSLNTTAVAVASNFPTLNQNSTGSAGSLSAASALPNATTAITQTAKDSSGNVATTKYVDVATAGGSFLPVITSNNGSATTLSADSAIWIRSGKEVSFSGTFTASSTLGSGGSCLIQIQVPIPSALAGGHACFGTATTTDFEIIGTVNNGSAASNGRINSLQVSGAGWAQVHWFSQTNNPSTFGYTVHYILQ